MTAEELALQLRQSQAEATDLRTKVFTLQKDLDRTEKRLHKANATSTKLEGLLMQTEGEVDALRVQYSDASTVADNARRDQQNLLAALGDSEQRVERIRDALSQKDVELQTHVGEARDNAERARDEVQRALESQREVEARMIEEVARRDALVERVRTELAEERRLQQGRLESLERQREEQADLIKEKEDRCRVLVDSLEDNLLKVANLQMRLKEVQFDAHHEVQNLQAALAERESDMLHIREELAEKRGGLLALENEKAKLQAALDDNVCKLDDTMDKLTTAECSLASLHQQMAQLTSESGSRVQCLQSDLAAKISELSETRRLLEERSAVHQNQVDQLSQREKDALVKVDEQVAEISSLSSRLDASQTALQVLQTQHERAISEFTDKERALKEVLSAKESFVQELQSTIEACQQAFNEKLLSQAGQLTKTMESLEAKDFEMQTLLHRLQKAESECERLNSQLVAISEERIKTEAQLKSQLSLREDELNRMEVTLQGSSQEAQRLHDELESVENKLKQFETKEQEMVSKFRSDLEAAQLFSVEAASEQSKLHEMQSKLENTVNEQKKEIDIFRCAAESHASQKKELENALGILRSEKEGIEKDACDLQEQISNHQKEKQAIAEEMQGILSERSVLSEQLAEMKKVSTNLINEAQVDAAATIAELQTKYEELKQQLYKTLAEGEAQVQSLKAQLCESRDESAKKDKALESLSAVHREEQARLQHALAEKDELLNEKVGELSNMKGEFAQTENILNQQVFTKETTLQDQTKIIHQLEAEVSHFHSCVRDLEEKNDRMKTAIASSDSLLARASKENAELMKCLDESTEEFHKTLCTTSKLLNESQQSESLSKSAYILLLERLQQLHALCGFTEFLDSDNDNSRNSLHERANLIIVQLEEHFYGGVHLEDEVVKLKDNILSGKRSCEELIEEKRKLENSVSELKDCLEAKEKEVEGANTQLKDVHIHLSSTKEQMQRELQSMLHSKDEANKRIAELQEEVGRLEDSNNTLCSEKLVLEKTCKVAKGGLQEKEQEVNALVAREEELRQLILKHQRIAAAASASREEQERAAEITATSMQRQLTETEASLVEMTKNYRRSEVKATELSNALDNTSAQRDSLTAKVTELNESNRVFAEAVEKQQSEARETADVITKKLKASEEALLYLQQSSAEDLREANSFAETVQEHCSSAERERDDLRERIDSLVNSLKEADLEKSSVECELEEARDALSNKEDVIAKLQENVDLLESKIWNAEDDLDKARREGHESFEALQKSSAEELNSAKACAAAAEERCAILQKENGEISGNAAATSASLEQVMMIKKSVESRLEESENILREKDVSIEELQGNTKTLRDKLQKLEEGLERTIAESEKRVFSLQHASSEAVREAQSLAVATQERASIVERERDQCKEKITALLASLDDLRLGKDSAKSEHEATKEAPCEETDKNSRLPQTFTNLEDSVQVLEGSLDNILERLKTAEEERDHACQKLATLCSSFEELRSEKESIESAFKNAQEAILDKESIAKQLQESCSDLQNNLRKAENAFENAKAEVMLLRKQTQSLELEMVSKTNSFEKTLQELSENLRSQHLEEQERHKDEFNRKFEEASKLEDTRVTLLKSERDSLAEKKESLLGKYAELNEELSREKSSKLSAISKLSEKLEVLEVSHTSVLKQKEVLETELATRDGEMSELAQSCDSLQAQLQSKDKELTGLIERLNVAERSIEALEDKARGMSDEMRTSSKDHEAIVEDMLRRLQFKQDEVDEGIRLRKSLEIESQKRLAEVERLERVVNKLQQQKSETGSTIHNLENLLDEKTEEMVQTRTDFGKENEALHMTCEKLERRLLDAAETVQAEKTIRNELQAQLEGMRRELEMVRVQAVEQENILRESEAKTVDAETEVVSMRSRLAEIEAMLNVKTEALAEAERAAEEARNSSYGEASEEMRQKQEELQRRAEKLALHSQKVGRKLKRVEKMLLAEKKKARAVLDEMSMVAKRQVSPSAKGISPAMKRVRDSGREPLSPMTTNARPPLAPMSGVRLKF